MGHPAPINLARDQLGTKPAERRLQYRLEKGGATLELRALEIPGRQVAEVRYVVLKLRA